MALVHRTLIAGLCLGLLPGCTNALRTGEVPTTRLSGRLQLDGRGLGPGWLEIVPAGGTQGVLRSAPVKPDGSFEVDGVPVGSVAVRIAGPPLPRTGDAGMDRFLFLARRAAAIRLTTVAENPPIDLELREQRTAFERIYGTQY